MSEWVTNLGKKDKDKRDISPKDGWFKCEFVSRTCDVVFLPPDSLVLPGDPELDLHLHPAQ